MKTPLPEKFQGSDQPTRERNTINQLIDCVAELLDEVEKMKGAGLHSHNECFGLKPNHEEKVEEKPKRRRAEKDGEYWFVNDFGYVLTDLENNDDVDNYRYATGNYHRTEEEALAYKAKLLEWAKTL